MGLKTLSDHYAELGADFAFPNDNRERDDADPPENVDMTSEAQPRRKNIKSAPQDAERSRQDADAPHRSVDTTNRA